MAAGVGLADRAADESSLGPWSSRKTAERTRRQRHTAGGACAPHRLAARPAAHAPRARRRRVHGGARPRRAAADAAPRRLGCLLFALFFVAFGVIAYFWDSYRIAAIVGVILFFVRRRRGPAVAARRNRQRRAGTPFAATVAEFEKDRAALARTMNLPRRT